MLKKFGVKKGDVVLIFMPNIPEAVYTMLACARIGAIHSFVFGGFSAHELANRIIDCKPKLIVSASSGYGANRIINYRDILEEAYELANCSSVKSLIL